MSFLALYDRVFPPPSINRIALYGTAAFVIVYTIVIMFVNVSHDHAVPATKLTNNPPGIRMRQPLRRLETHVPQPRLQRPPSLLLHHGSDQHPHRPRRPPPPHQTRPRPQRQPAQKEQVPPKPTFKPPPLPLTPPLQPQSP